MRWSSVLLAVTILSGVSAARADEMMSVRVAKAHFRDGPSTSNDILYTADRHYPVRVVSCEQGWCRTKDFEGEVAWVARRLLGDKPAVVVTVDHANVRREPSATAKVLYQAVRAEALRVLDRHGVWLEVKDAEGTQGWIHRGIVWGMVHADEAQR